MIVNRCSTKVIKAVQRNIKFDKENILEHRSVRSEIIRTIVAHLDQVFGGHGKPKLSEMREVAYELGFLYPAMFKDESNFKGYGLGGSKGIDGLANSLLDSFRAMQGSRKKKNESTDTLFEKKNIGKRMLIYGVDNDKWYKEVKKEPFRRC